MDAYLSIAEANQKEAPIKIDEGKLRQIATRVAIWDHFDISGSYYLALDKDEKSKMLHEYYKKLVPIYCQMGKNFLFFPVWSEHFLAGIFVWYQLVFYWYVF